MHIALLDITDAMVSSLVPGGYRHHNTIFREKQDKWSNRYSSSSPYPVIIAGDPGILPKKDTGQAIC